MPDLPTLTSVDQLKRQLHITGSWHDQELQLYVGAASNVARNILAADGLTFEAGAEIPPDATLATLFIAQHFWEMQRSGAEDGRPGVSGGDSDDSIVMRGFAIPRRAAQLLTTMLAARATHGPQFSFPEPWAYPADR